MRHVDRQSPLSASGERSCGSLCSEKGKLRQGGKGTEGEEGCLWFSYLCYWFVVIVSIFIDVIIVMIINIDIIIITIIVIGRRTLNEQTTFIIILSCLIPINLVCTLIFLPH